MPGYESDMSDLQGSVPRTSRCLLANDNGFLLEAFRFQLIAHFDFVDVAENGKEVLEAVKKYTPNFYDAIILDISMPVMDGM